MVSSAQFRVEHVARAPRGWRVRTRLEGRHRVEAGGCARASKAGAGELVEILHPKGENPSCDVAKQVEQRKQELVRQQQIADVRKGSRPAATNKRKRNLAGEELVIFGNPKRKKKNATGVGPGSWVHTPGRSEVYRVVEMQGGPRNRRYLLEGPYPSRGRVWTRTGRVYLAASPNPRKRKRNDGELDQAVDLFREFHGADPKAIVSRQRSAAMRKTYTAVGPLLGVGIFTKGEPMPEPEHWDRDYPNVDFRHDGITLASNAEGSQLYAIGGKQSLSKAALQQFPDADESKDLVALCEAAFVVYIGRKPPDYEPVEWMHEFKSPRPVLGYDAVKQELFFVGGRYRLEGNWLEH